MVDPPYISSPSTVLTYLNFADVTNHQPPYQFNVTSCVVLGPVNAGGVYMHVGENALRCFARVAMHSFVLHCPELVTEDVTRRLLPSLECALTMTIQ